MTFHRKLLGAAAMSATLCSMLVVSAAAQASFEITSFSAKAQAAEKDAAAADPNGGAISGYPPFTADTTDDSDATLPAQTQAGAPSYWNMSVGLENADPPMGMGTVSPDAIKDLTIHMPPGWIGNPEVTGKCKDLDFPLQSGSVIVFAITCPSENVIARFAFAVWQVAAPTQNFAAANIYNVEGDGSPARSVGVATNPFSGSIAAAATRLPAGVGVVRTGDDYGVDIVAKDAAPFFGSPSTPIAVRRFYVSIWGYAANGAPFSRNPTSCSPGTVTIELASHGGAHSSASDTITPTGCDQVPFTPSFSVQPDDTRAFTPAGYDVDVQYPHSEDAPIHQAHLRKTVATLPKGTVLNPSAAKGLEACTAVQFDRSHDTEPGCPGASEIGDVKIATDILSRPLTGKAFFAAPASTAPPTPAHPWHVYLYAKGSGVRVKLAGDTYLDQNTGQVTTVVADSPQTPFNDFDLKLHGGPNGVVANTDCGTYTGTADLTPWSSPTQTPASFADPSPAEVTADGAGASCADPKPFAPSVAVSANPDTAGAHSSSHISIGRPDGHELLKKLSLSLPAGAVGSLTTVPLCAAAAARAGTCSDESKVGTLKARVGYGSSPLDVTGRVYIAEPTSDGDVATVVTVIPSKAGPIDLGDVVVLNHVRLRPSDGGLDVTSDEIPTILGGIPLPIRQIDIDISRPGFFQNPTGCDVRTLNATFTSDAGHTASATASTQATGCDALGFTPRLRLIAEAQGQTKRFQHTALRAIVTQTDGEANITGTRVVLPQILRPDNQPLLKPGGICSQAQLVAGACPAPSQVGEASAITPLLPAPLRGPIYVVQVPGRPLPDLAVMLRGAVAIQLNAHNAIEGVRTVNTFEGVPDVPVTRFELFIKGGTNGILKNFADVCDKRDHADAVFTAHSGKSWTSQPQLEVQGCGLELLTSKARVTRAGSVLVKLRCSVHSVDACKGKLTLKARGGSKSRQRQLAGKHYELQPGQAKNVSLKLTKRVRRQLVRKRHLPVDARALEQGVAAQQTPMTKKLTLLPPKHTR